MWKGPTNDADIPDQQPRNGMEILGRKITNAMQLLGVRNVAE